jgi:hypothetical protein
MVIFDGIEMEPAFGLPLPREINQSFWAPRILYKLPKIWNGAVIYSLLGTDPPKPTVDQPNCLQSWVAGDVQVPAVMFDVTSTADLTLHFSSSLATWSVAARCRHLSVHRVSGSFRRKSQADWEPVGEALMLVEEDAENVLETRYRGFLPAIPDVRLMKPAVVRIAAGETVGLYVQCLLGSLLVAPSAPLLSRTPASFDENMQVFAAQVMNLEFAEPRKADQRNVTFQGILPYTLGTSVTWGMRSEDKRDTVTNGSAITPVFYAIAVCLSLLVGAAATVVALWYRRRRKAALPTADGQEMSITIAAGAVPVAHGVPVQVAESLNPLRTAVTAGASGGSSFASARIPVAVAVKGELE